MKPAAPPKKRKDGEASQEKPAPYDLKAEAKMMRCFRCYHLFCTCPPGKGLNG